MRGRRVLGWVLLAGALAGCADAFEYGPNYLFREKTTRGHHQEYPPQIPLIRDVPNVYNAIVAFYLFRGSIPSDPSQFTSVDALLASLNDPFTFEVDQSGVDAFDTGAQGGKGFGVARIDSMIYVNTIDPGGPAWRQGLRRNDVVDQLNALTIDPTTTDFDISQALGEDPLTIDVRRAGAPLSFTVADESFTTISVEEQSIDADTHYVRIGGFPLQSVDPGGPSGELAAILQANPNKSRWVLDLRFNGGGSLTRSCETVDLFVSSGTIVTLEDHLGLVGTSCIAIAGDPGEQRQVVVLINGGSASASELVAAALEDRLNAPTVGEVSFGKGVAQTLFDYTNGDRLVLVTHRVLSPLRRFWNGVGLTPDVAVTVDPFLLVTTGEDTQLTAAINAFGAPTSRLTRTAAPAPAPTSPIPTNLVRPVDLIRMR